MLASEVRSETQELDVGLADYRRDLSMLMRDENLLDGIVVVVR